MTEIKTPLEFLRWLRPEGPWFLSAAPPDCPMETRRFIKDEHRALTEWVKRRYGKQNIWFALNPIRPEYTKDKKTEKKDVAALAWLHVDCDARPGEALKKCRTRTLEDLRKFKPSPSLIIMSGNGHQGFWRLAEPVPVSEEWTVEKLEAYNRHLEDLLAGDACHNIDRIMRLPFTTNMPTEKKKLDGKVEIEATLVECHESKYELKAFDAAEEAAGASSGPDQGPGPQEAGPVDVDALPLTDDQKALIRDGAAPGENRSDRVFYITCELVRLEVPDATIEAILLDKSLGISAHIYDQGSPPGYARKQVRNAHKKAGGRIFNPAAPLATAETMIRDRYTAHGHPILLHVNGIPMLWASTNWREAREGTLDSHCSNYLGAARQPGKGKEPPGPYNPTNQKIAELQGALGRSTFVDADEVAAPCWRGCADQRPPADEILSCRNGLLHLPTGLLLDKDPLFYNLNAVDYGYDPSAPAPGRWLKFLKQLWPGDPKAIACLQEIFGYMLTPDTSQQKLFLLIGPKRAGKGTIGHILTGLVGKANVVSPTLSSLGDKFGRQCLVGKQVALISNFLIGRKTDEAAVAEHLLSISGEDDKTVPRKHILDWTGHLGVRFFMESNIPPGFKDPSGALASRFILLTLTTSWIDKEDPALKGKLLKELPGILNWSIEGWSRLQERGHFEMPKSSQTILKALEDATNPEGAFVRDECVVDNDAWVARRVLYGKWVWWNNTQGHKWVGDDSKFGINLRASVPNIGDARPRDEDGKRVRAYTGIRLKTDEEKDEPESPF